MFEPIRVSMSTSSVYPGSTASGFEAAATIASAFAAVRDSYSMTAMNTDIDMLDGKISGAVQLSLYRAVQDLLRFGLPDRSCSSRCALDGRV